MSRLQYRATGRLSDLPAPLRRVLVFRRMTTDADVRSTVTRLIDDVRTRGDAALMAQAREYDRTTLTELEVPRSEWQRALGTLSPDLRDALERAATNIACAHRAWLPQRQEVEVESGVRLIRRPVPLNRAGIYVPGGGAVYASSLLMGVVPARIAGVEDVVVCTPSAANGRPAALILAAAEVAGASRVFAAGGAGAIAAMALGTQSIPQAACIAGPGNAYVTEAKLQLMREVRVDVPAGPSELLGIADESADADAVAAEMLAQAEHGPGSAVVGVALGRNVADRLEAALANQIVSLARSQEIRAALEQHGAILEAGSIEEALDFVEEYAPEHLLLATCDAASQAERVRNAGSVFLQDTSVVFGDYMTGSNHVLPTAGYARTHSGLATDFFMRWVTIQNVTPAAAQRMAPAVAALAEAEGLGAHAGAALRAGRLLPADA